MRALRVGDEPLLEEHLLRPAADPDHAALSTVGRHGRGGGQSGREPRLRHRREGRRDLGVLVRRSPALEVDVEPAAPPDRRRDRSARQRLRREQRQRHRREVHRRRQAAEELERAGGEVDRGRRRAGLRPDDAVQRRRRVQLLRASSSPASSRASPTSGGASPATSRLRSRSPRRSGRTARAGRSWSASPTSRCRAASRTATA